MIFYNVVANLQLPDFKDTHLTSKNKDNPTLKAFQVVTLPY